MDRRENSQPVSYRLNNGAEIFICSLCTVERCPSDLIQTDTVGFYSSGKKKKKKLG